MYLFSRKNDACTALGQVIKQVLIYPKTVMSSLRPGQSIFLHHYSSFYTNYWKNYFIKLLIFSNLISRAKI